MERNQVQFRESMERRRAVEYLERVARDLEDGKFEIKSDGDSIILEPEEMVRLEVEAKHKKGREKLQIDLSWAAEGSAGEETELEESIGGKAEGMAESIKRMPLNRMAPTLIVAAGVLAYRMISRMRKKSRAREIIDIGKEEGEKLLGEGRELMAEGQEIIDRARSEASRLLRRSRRAARKILT